MALLLLPRLIDQTSWRGLALGLDHLLDALVIGAG